MPFGREGFRKAAHDPVTFLGIAFVSKVTLLKILGGARDDDGAWLCTMGDFPLKELVSDRQSTSSESDILPPGQGRVGQWQGQS